MGEGLWRLALRTETLPPADHTSAFVLGWQRALLVEPAPTDPAERGELLAWLKAQRRRGLRLQALLLTHHHPDHVGAAEWLRARLGVPVWAHRATAERLPFAVDRLLEETPLQVTGVHGERREVLPLWTPGHAPGHLAFWLPWAGTVLAGDMVSTESTIVVDPEDGGDMAAYRASLRRLAALGAERIAPAHGPPAPAAPLLEHFLAHREARERRVLAALSPVPRSEEDLLGRAYADTPRALWPLARRSLRAHLLELLARGLVEREGERWRRTGPEGG